MPGRRRRMRPAVGAILATVAALGALAPATLVAGPAFAADPSTPPAGRSCGDRFPADGPAGVDLQLGCLAGELVAHYTGQARPVDPTPLSGYLPQLLVVAGLVVAVLVAAVAARWILGRRLAPVLPLEWWSCQRCRSVNAVGAAGCYRCGAPRSPDAATLRTVEHPETPQAFGHDWRDD